MYPLQKKISIDGGIIRIDSLLYKYYVECNIEVSRC